MFYAQPLWQTATRREKKDQVGQKTISLLVG